MINKIILHTNSSLLICANDIKDDMTNVVFTQQTQSSCENHTLDDLWFSRILQLGNHATERRTESIRLKCKRYCLGQAVIKKLLKMKIIHTEDTTYSWNPPHNGLLYIYSTQTCHVHNTNHSTTQKLPPLAYHTVIRNTYFKTINSCTCNLWKTKCFLVPLPLLQRRSKDSEEL